MSQSRASERLFGVLLSAGAVGGLTDAELLERFVERDERAAEPAFAVLVERHGPLVLRVCRSVLRQEHAAEDAFQATFLVLVKKAASLRVQTSLAPWLHAVAVRVSREARKNMARRARHEQRVAELANRTREDVNQQREDLERQLHEEIARLAERHRLPIVLCDLEGLTHEQAARVLGTPVGTIKSRLARAREKLRDRVARRGMAISVGALAKSMEPSATASRQCSSAIVDAMSRRAVLFGQTGLAEAGSVPASVAILVQGVLKSMARTKLKLAAAGVISMLGIAVGVGFAALNPRRGQSQRRSSPCQVSCTRRPVNSA